MTDEERKAQEAQEQAAKQMQKFADALDDLVSRQKQAEKESVENTKKRFKDLDAALRNGRKRWTDVVEDLRELEDSINDVTDANEKQALQKTLDDRKSAARNAQYHKLLIDGAEQVAKGLISAGTNITKSVIGSYQSGASAFQMFGDASIAGIDATNRTVQGVTGVMSAVGTALMPLGGYGIAAGLALNALASIASATSESFSELAKFGINVAVKEIEATTKAYKQATTVGALFADGIDGIRRGSVEAGLTMVQFAKIVSDNYEGLAAFGGSVTGGMEAFKQLHKAMLPARQGLIALGYSIEDIAEGTANYMAMVGSVSTRQRTDYTNLAKETDSYLTNLKLISAFTGKDAKKLEEEARKRETQAAVQAKIMRAENPQEELKRFRRAMELAIPGTEDAVSQLYATGAVVGDSAVMLAQLPETAGYVQRSVEMIGNSTLSYENMSKQLMDMQITNSKKYRDEQLAASEVFGSVTILGQGYDKISQNLSEQVQHSTRISKMSGLTADNFETHVKAIKDQGGDLTKNTGKYAQLVVEGQDLSIRVQEHLDAVITQFERFSNVTKAVIDGIEKALIKAGFTPTPTTGPTPPPNPRALTEKISAGVRQMFKRPEASDYGAEAEGAAGGKSGIKLTTNYQGVMFKKGGEGEATAGGGVDERLVQAAIKIREKYPNTWVTAFNDAWHIKNNPKSAHATGRAADMHFSGLTDEKIAEIKQLVGGLAKADIHANRTGGPGTHLHLESLEKLAKGGITDGASIAGEAGPEAVIPLPDGRNIPVRMDVRELVAKLDEMIDVLKDHADTSEKILQAQG